MGSYTLKVRSFIPTVHNFFQVLAFFCWTWLYYSDYIIHNVMQSGPWGGRAKQRQLFVLERTMNKARFVFAGARLMPGI